VNIPGPEGGLPPPPTQMSSGTETPRGPRILLVALAAIVLLAGGLTAGVFLGIHSERERWQPLYQLAVHNAAHWKADSERWQQRSRRAQDQLSSLRSDVSSAVGTLDAPHFVLWNSCGSQGPDAGCPLVPGREYIGGVPDTFTYDLSFHSTVPVTVWILDSDQFICRETRACPVNGLVWRDRTTLDTVFHGAEGCAGYIAVWESSQAGTLYPNVAVTRSPAAQPTGVCAQ
jgi:hypothetical protein